eukprot:CAMPEP_0201477340 /NCGR_PEP_ID=MMETSP0151_2-20130828/2372_1 /ASSEMBLY_ACC=CAM_ASM_000257 /TAXON_ID=200890 /ORGANISM="Paramoeba atlantica, Strain 621/1 / CCAP 1560/9" /LENGTH=367 /DNA_ID=CAMNT_0047858021 /DNA_START=408 /DNA_END=1511 /DNA_ORIENTATION=+
MNDLEENEIYYYYVGSAPEFLSDIYDFVTPDSQSDSVRFLAFGDVGTEPRGQSFLFHQIRQRTIKPGHTKSNPDLVLHAGDLMYPFGNVGMISTWFDMLQKVGAHVPYMIAAGNRDMPDLVTERFNMPFSTAGGHPEPSRHNFYYSFDLKSVHFVIISTNFDAYHPESTQYRWLKEDLSVTRDHIKDTDHPLQWIVLIGHTPIYSSSDGHTQGNHELRAAIEHLLEGVTLCLWGDDHVYERSWPLFQQKHETSSDKHDFENRPKSPIHITVGTGGIENDGWAVDQPSWSAFRHVGFGYLDVKATRDSFEVQFIDRDSDVIRDHFTISLSKFFSFSRETFFMIGGIVLVGILLVFIVGKRNKKGPLSV